jgi:hypothetical protein
MPLPKKEHIFNDPKPRRETFVTQTGITLPVITWPETAAILLAVIAFTIFMRTYFPSIFG